MIKYSKPKYNFAVQFIYQGTTSPLSLNMKYCTYLETFSMLLGFLFIKLKKVQKLSFLQGFSADSSTSICAKLNIQLQHVYRLSTIL